MPSCSNDDSKPFDETELKSLYKEIQKMADSQTCEDSDFWSFTAFGSKPCGGPNSYIAYSTKIDVTLFLAKVEQYNSGVADYNRRNGIISDCAMVAKPTGLICKEGKPVFTYSGNANY
ncbi:hypothetical protein [Arenibacter sp. H213]|uniref:Uncharacterized protein n=1 Tax=Arenibacter antarcticus TaxID=2040469 RepID=A0ABW5VJR3_9FLAO|nr:hypothetical protein [Arenibacter sp. H213]